MKNEQSNFEATRDDSFNVNFFTLDGAQDSRECVSCLRLTLFRWGVGLELINCQSGEELIVTQYMNRYIHGGK